MIRGAWHKYYHDLLHAAEERTILDMIPRENNFSFPSVSLALGREFWTRPGKESGWLSFCLCQWSDLHWPYLDLFLRTRAVIMKQSNNAITWTRSKLDPVKESDETIVSDKMLNWLSFVSSSHFLELVLEPPLSNICHWVQWLQYRYWWTSQRNNEVSVKVEFDCNCNQTEFAVGYTITFEIGQYVMGRYSQWKCIIWLSVIGQSVIGQSVIG